ncbi:hypothetical protein [Christensenella timonensis]|uniref:hypothetical protein n=1 Tax=Christensenella timonensis TaxID=1816678 RepID=UPI00082F09C5|nr:hypothetical protein [Christensenella timonensis]
MVKRTKIIVAVLLAVITAMGLCACAPEDGLTELVLELPDGSVVDMLEQSSVNLPKENIGKEVKLRGTKVVDGKEISKELKTYELKEGYNDLTVHVSLGDGAADKRTITVFVELENPPLKSSKPSDAAEPPEAGANE